MMKAITQIEAYGYQEVIKSWSTNHYKIKTVISNCETSRTSCYHSKFDALISSQYPTLHCIDCAESVSLGARIGRGPRSWI